MKKSRPSLILLILLTAQMQLLAEVAPKQRIVKVGFFEFAGYHEIAQDGTKSGYGYDFLQKLARYTDWSYEYTGYKKSWNDMQKMLADGEIDILTSAQKTPERKALFAFSDKPIGSSAIILTAKSGDNRFSSGLYNTYNGMRVGMINGSSRNKAFEAFAKQHHFTFVPVYFDNSEKMIEALQNSDTVDTLLTSNLRTIKNEWVLDQFAPSDFYVMVRKDNTNLLAEINAAIAQMDLYDSSWRTDLWNTYYKTDSGEEISFSAKERYFIDYMNKKGMTFTAIVNPDRAPYSYFENGEAKGIIPELFKEIAKRTRLSFNIVETKNREEYWDKIKENTIDVRIDTYYNYYEAECVGYKLTEPYISTSISCISRKSFTGTPHTVAELRYADHTIPYKSVISKSDYTYFYDSINDCLQAVIKNKVDTAYLYTYTAQKIVNEDIRNRLTTTIYPQYNVSFAVGVSTNEDPCLLTILNKAVSSIRADYVEQIITTQTGKLKSSVSFTDYLITHPITAVFFICFITILIILLVAFIMRQHNMTVLENKNRELAVAIEKADKASHAKSGFLSRMSHEMRTPMNAIVGITAIAKGHLEEPQKIADYLNKIDSSSHLLLGIINDVLDMSAIESNKISIAHESFNLTNNFSAIKTLYDVQCRNKGISFVLDDQVKVASVIGDPLRINQILLNLISNAYKFTASGSITLHAETISSTRIKKGNITLVEFAVSDTGCGMTDEMLSRLFQPFEQESTDTAQKYGGSGLGLAITKHLIDLMGGTISVKSKKREGTTFTIIIPLEIDVTSNSSTDTVSSDAIHNIDFTGKRFLLAEDNELNREIAVELLANMHAKTDTAENGKIAVDMFNTAAPGTYDIILMDMQMPELNGVQATLQIRSLNHPQAKTIPILAMTANAYKEDIESCLAAGMNGHLAKPIDPNLLYNTINDLLLK